MNVKRYVLIVGIIAGFWISYCFGHHVAVEASAIRAARIVQSHVQLTLSAAEKIQSNEYEGGIDILNGGAASGLRFVDETESDLEISLLTIIFRPDAVVIRFIIDISETFPEQEKLDDLRIRLDAAKGRGKSMGSDSID